MRSKFWSVFIYTIVRGTIRTNKIIEGWIREDEKGLYA